MEDKNSRRGAPKGRRPVIWVCEAIDGCTCGNAKLKSEKILLNDQDPCTDNCPKGCTEHGSFPREAAEKVFFEMHGITPENSFGPMYEKKGAQLTTKRKSYSIDRDTSGIRLCKVRKQRQGILDGWYGIVNYIENDNELVYFCFVREVSSSTRAKRAPMPGKVNMTEVTFND